MSFRKQLNEIHLNQDCMRELVGYLSYNACLRLRRVSRSLRAEVDGLISCGSLIRVPRTYISIDTSETASSRSVSNFLETVTLPISRVRFYSSSAHQGSLLETDDMSIFLHQRAAQVTAIQLCNVVYPENKFLGLFCNLESLEFESVGVCSAVDYGKYWGKYTLVMGVYPAGYVYARTGCVGHDPTFGKLCDSCARSSSVFQRIPATLKRLTVRLSYNWQVYELVRRLKDLKELVELRVTWDEDRTIPPLHRDALWEVDDWVASAESLKILHLPYIISPNFRYTLGVQIDSGFLVPVDSHQVMNRYERQYPDSDLDVLRKHWLEARSCFRSITALLRNSIFDFEYPSLQTALLMCSGPLSASPWGNFVWLEKQTTPVARWDNLQNLAIAHSRYALHFQFAFGGLPRPNLTRLFIIHPSMDAVQASLVPASEDATETSLVPASEDATETSLVPASEDATETSLVPASEDATETSLVPASEDATETSFLPTAVTMTGVCPNLTVLALSVFPGDDTFFNQLWEGLPQLEYLQIHACAQLGDPGFIGGDKDQPSFFLLSKLKYVELTGLNEMRRVTGALLEHVISRMPLRFLRLAVETVNPEFTKELCRSRLAPLMEATPEERFQSGFVENQRPLGSVEPLFSRIVPKSNWLHEYEWTPWFEFSYDAPAEQKPTCPVRVLDTFTFAHLESLTTGVFATTVEKLDLTNMVLEGVTREQIAKLAKSFRSSNMI